MKKLSYYAASFAVCCMMSAAFTSCVDETEEPDYVKQVREAEMKAEIAKNEKDAKENGKASEAAFTDAYLNATMSTAAKDAYSDYNSAKAAYDFANRQLEQATANFELFYKSIENKKVQIDALQTTIDGYVASSATVAEKAAHDTDVSKLAAYNNGNEGPFDFYTKDSYTGESFGVKLPYALTSDPGEWEKTCGNYLYCKKALADITVIYTEKKDIYDAAIEAQKNANN